MPAEQQLIEFDANVYAGGDEMAVPPSSPVPLPPAQAMMKDQMRQQPPLISVVGLEDDNGDTLARHCIGLSLCNNEASIVTGDVTAEIHDDLENGSEVTGAAFSTDSGEGLDVLADATVTGSALTTHLHPAPLAMPRKRFPTPQV